MGIVNVTGSNSVNVFLGLGLSWTIGSIYWAIVGRSKEWEDRYPDIAGSISGPAFVVESANLGFSVLVYTACSVLGIALLIIRRKFLSCELGGPRAPKVSTSLSFVILWVSYVVLVSWRVS